MVSRRDFYYETPEDVDLKVVQFSTKDGTNIGGMLFVPKGKKTEKAVIVLPGIASEFYGSVPGFLGPGLAHKGISVLSLNTRNHGTQYSYSSFDDCLEDIEAALDGMSQRYGYNSFSLAGHSLGCTEAVYYAATKNDPRVKSLVLLGAHYDLKGSTEAFFRAVNPADPASEYKNYLKRCEELVASGKGKTLLIRPHSLPHPSLGLEQEYIAESAQTFESYRKPESNCSIEKWIKDVKIPMFLPSHEIVTTLASPEFSYQIQKAAVNSPKCDVQIIKKTGHSYQGGENETVEAIATWLRENVQK